MQLHFSPVTRVALACAVFLLSFFLTIDSVALLHRYRDVICPRGRSFSVTLVQTLTGLLLLGVPFQEILDGTHCEWQILGTWFGVQLLASPLLVQLYRIYNLVLIETDKIRMHQVRKDRREFTTFMQRSARNAEGFTQVCLAVLLAIPSIIFVVNLAQNNGNISCPTISAQGTFTAPLILCALSILLAIIGCAILWRSYSVARGAISELVPQLILVVVGVILAYSVQAGTNSPMALYFLNIMVMTWQTFYIFIPVHINQRRVKRELTLAAEISVVHSQIGSTTALHRMPSRIIVRALPIHTLTEGEFSRALIESPETLALVLEHLRRKFCVENLIFLQQAWAYEEEPTLEMMEHLYEWFIRVGSPLELSILNAEKTRVRQGVERVREQVRTHIAATNAYMAAMAPPAPNLDPALVNSIAYPQEELASTTTSSAHSDHSHDDQDQPVVGHEAGVSSDESKSRRLSPDDASFRGDEHKPSPEISLEDGRLSPDMSSSVRNLVDNHPRSSNSSLGGMLLYSPRHPSSPSNTSNTSTTSTTSSNTNSSGISYPSTSGPSNSPDRAQSQSGNFTLIAIAEDLEGPRLGDINNDSKVEQVQVQDRVRRTTALENTLEPNLDRKTSTFLVPTRPTSQSVNPNPRNEPMIGFAPPPLAPPTPPPEIFRVTAFLVLRIVKATLPKSLTLPLAGSAERNPNPLYHRARRGFTSREDPGSRTASPQRRGFTSREDPGSRTGSPQRSKQPSKKLSAIPVGRASTDKESGSNHSNRASRQLSAARDLEDRLSARLSQLGVHRKSQLSLKLNPVEIQAELQNELQAHVEENMLGEDLPEEDPIAALSVARLAEEDRSAVIAAPAVAIPMSNHYGMEAAVPMSNRYSMGVAAPPATLRPDRSPRSSPFVDNNALPRLDRRDETVVIDFYPSDPFPIPAYPSGCRAEEFDL